MSYRNLRFSINPDARQIIVYTKGKNGRPYHATEMTGEIMSAAATFLSRIPGHEYRMGFNDGTACIVTMRWEEKANA